jgi:hypothetical protein
MRPGRLSLATLAVSAGILYTNGDAPAAQSANAVASAGEFIVEPATLNDRVPNSQFPTPKEVESVWKLEVGSWKLSLRRLTYKPRAASCYE